jgi:hypothetical protein
MPDYSCLGTTIKKAMPHEKHPKTWMCIQCLGCGLKSSFLRFDLRLELEHQAYAADGCRIGDVNSIFVSELFVIHLHVLQN